jgi:hypothetical protein
MEEVHLWRGTTEQRALRSLSGKLGRFAYFDQQLNYPDWRAKVVLDFGGNEGNLLLDHNCSISPDKYYCIDVIKEALDQGRKRFPQSHWIHYNRYNCSFNPTGIEGLPIPKVGISFDMILAYSVFTHTTREEMHDLIEQLLECLTSNGTLAFTFVDPHYQSWPARYSGGNLQWRLEKVRETNPSVDVEDLVERSRYAQWCALVNGTDLHLNSSGEVSDEGLNCITYNVFYSAAFLSGEFPGAVILPPVNGEMQHCCLMRRRE